jgi:hypothetical protein
LRELREAEKVIRSKYNPDPEGRREEGKERREGETRHGGSCLKSYLLRRKREIRRIAAGGQLGKKFTRLHVNQWLGFGDAHLSSQTTPGNTNRRIMIQVGPWE